MMKQIRINLRATKVFFFVRFVLSLLIGFVYIFIAANVQYMFVSILGESTFNYIIGGLLSLMAGIAICGVLSRFVFMFVRGWHMAALAYATKILKRHLSPLDAGMTVFKKHFSSFAVVYGASVAMRKAADCAADNLWDLLEDVPFLGTLRQFADNPIVSKVAKDILDTAFDAAVFYAVKYTKPGIGDDVNVIGTALKKYLFALPQIVIGSLTSFLLFYIFPKIAAFMLILYMFLHEGFVAGILICVLLYPIFFILRNTFFNPMETIILISGFAKYCKEETEEIEAENEGLYGTVVNAILDELGLDLGGEEEEEETGEESEGEDSNDEEAEAEEEIEEPVKTKVKPTPRSRRSEGAPAGKRKRAVQQSVQQKPAPVVKQHEDIQEELEISVEPEFEEEGSQQFEIVSERPVQPDEDITAEVIRRASSAANGPRLSDLMTKYRETQVMQEEPPVPEEPVSPIEMLSSGLGGLSGDQLAGLLNASDDDDDDSSGDSGSMFDNILGGGSLDVL